MTAAVSVLAGCGSRTGLLGGTSTSELDGGASGQSIAAARLDDELRRQRGRLKQFLRHERFRRQWRQLERFQFEQQFRIEQLDGVHAHGHAVLGHGRRDVRVERPVGDGGGARRASELHDKRWGGGVHLQRRRDLHGLGERVRDDVHLGDLRRWTRRGASTSQHRRRAATAHAVPERVAPTRARSEPVSA